MLRSDLRVAAVIAVGSLVRSLRLRERGSAHGQPQKAGAEEGEKRLTPPYGVAAPMVGVSYVPIGSAADIPTESSEL